MLVRSVNKVRFLLVAVKLHWKLVIEELTVRLLGVRIVS